MPPHTTAQAAEGQQHSPAPVSPSQRPGLNLNLLLDRLRRGKGNQHATRKSKISAPLPSSVQSPGPGACPPLLLSATSSASSSSASSLRTVSSGDHRHSRGHFISADSSILDLNGHSSSPSPSSPQSSASKIRNYFLSKVSIKNKSADSTDGIWKTKIGKQTKQHRHGSPPHSAPSNISNRSSSLYFPSTPLNYDQEYICAYKAGFAASFADIRTTRQYRHSTAFEGEGYSDELLGLGAAKYTYNQDNFTCLELPTTTRYDTYSPYLLSPPRIAYDSQISLDSTYSVSSPKRLRRKQVNYSAIDMTAVQEYPFNALASGSSDRVNTWRHSFNSTQDEMTTSTVPPPVPPRSKLRSVASASNLSQKAAISNSPPPPVPASPFTSGAIVMRNQPVDKSLSASTTSTSASSISSVSSGNSPVVPATPPELHASSSGSGSGDYAAILARTKQRASVSQQHRRATSYGADPLRVKDGLQAKGASSGVYTPPTFRSSTSPASPAYTSHPSRPSAHPSSYPARSTSVSSTSTTSSSETPAPITPSATSPSYTSSRWFGSISAGVGSAVSGLKRASASVASRTYSNPTSPHTQTYTPTSAREGYFSQTIFEEKHSAWPVKPETLGLGIGGLPANDVTRRGRSESTATAGHVLVGDVPKGKRKPVPRPNDTAPEISEEPAHAL